MESAPERGVQALICVVSLSFDRAISPVTGRNHFKSLSKLTQIFRATCSLALLKVSRQEFFVQALKCGLTCTVLPKVLGHPNLMNRFYDLSHFREYKS